MIRHVSAVALALCVNTVSLAAQTGELQSTEITVKTAPADVHKSPTTASVVVGKAPIGTVLEIKRNLGSWVQVPWPAGEGGIAYLHVNTGTIARRATPIANGAALDTSRAPGSQALSASDMPDNPAALADRILANAPSESPRTSSSSILLPQHNMGMGARMNAFTPGFGAGFGVTGRRWWTSRLGLQFDVLHSRLGNLQGPGHVTSLQFAPSVLYALPDGIGSSLWIRPYVGGGGSLYRTTINRVTTDVASPGSENGLGIQAFGGAETTFAAMPQFAVSAEVGYRWSQVSTVGFAPRKIGVSLSAHWYLK
jgi:hypothetical protein